VRAAAAFAIGLLQDREILAAEGRETRPEAAAALMEALGDEDRAVVTRAVEALGKMGWQGAFPRITETPAPLPVTMTALARLGNPEAIPWVVSRLRSDDQDTRWSALFALRQLNVNIDAGLTRSLLNLIKDVDLWVRLEATRNLGRAPATPEVIEALSVMAQDRDPKVRMAALASIARLRQPASLPSLVRSLEDPNENVRRAAARAMTALEDPGVVPAPQGQGSPTVPAAHPPAPAIGDGHAGPTDPMTTPRAPEDYQRMARTVGRQVTVETTAGVLEIALDYENAALTAESFIELVRQGAFDGVRFAEVASGEWLKTVDPVLDPGIPRIVFRAEPNSQPFLRGSLAMASGAASTRGSFFICLSPQPLWNSRYTNFGRLVSGDQVLDSITPETRILRAAVQ
jgi:cyclophilin family peptidyl-prolyl cis-trans isomerase